MNKQKPGRQTMELIKSYFIRRIKRKGFYRFLMMDSTLFINHYLNDIRLSSFDLKNNKITY